jgi:carboxyl-terminal processing protease
MRAPILRLALLVLFAAGCLPFGPGAPTATPVARALRTPTPDFALTPAAPTTTPLPARTPEVPTPAPTFALLPTAEPATKLETVRIAYDLLLEKFVSPLSPQLLLEAGWAAALSEAGRVGLATTDLKPAFKDERVADYLAFSQAYNTLLTRGEGRLDRTALAFAVVNAMARSVNEGHTFFMNPQQTAARQAQAGGGERFGGIGVSSAAGPNGLIIVEVITGSPAERAGLVAGDTIVAVAGSTLTQDPTAATRIRGAIGTPVRLGIQRPGVAPFEVQAIRAEVAIPVLEWRILPDRTGYVRIRSFARSYARLPNGRTSTEELDAALEAFEAAGAERWVVDLRGNPGGSIAGLEGIAGRFIADGLIGISTNRDGARTDSLVDGHVFRAQRPLAVLVNQGSGSASEILAAAVQEYGRGKVVGVRTAGSVNGAITWALPDGASIQITVIEARTGKNRRSLEGNGVTPDLIVSDPRRTAEDFFGGRDPQLEQAIGALTGTPTLSAQPPPRGAALEPAELERLLRPYAAQPADLPASLNNLLGDRAQDTPSIYASGAPDALALRTKVINRRWQGSFFQAFGPQDPGDVFVSVQIYAAEDGAREAIRENDFPNSNQLIIPPTTFGEDTVAARGIGSNSGSLSLAWRRGRLTFHVSQRFLPGEETFDQLIEIARKIDARHQASPLR